jgi:hypothetical protein
MTTVTDKSLPPALFCSLQRDWISAFRMLLARVDFPRTIGLKYAAATIGLTGVETQVERRDIIGRLLAELTEDACFNFGGALTMLAADPREFANVHFRLKNQADNPKVSLDPAIQSVLAGWRELARGLLPEPADPIAFASEFLRESDPIYAVENFDPDPDTSSAPALCDWSFVRNYCGELLIKGRVSGDKRFDDGTLISTSPVAQLGSDWTWVQTRNTLYSLSIPREQCPAIVSAATARHWQDAVETLLQRADWAPALRRRAAAITAGSELWSQRERLLAAREINEMLESTEFADLADAWALLGFEQGQDDVAERVAAALRAARMDGIQHAVRGWNLLALGAVVDTDDPVVAGLAVVDQIDTTRRTADAKGIVVMRSIGGGSRGTGGKDARKEFEGFVGRAIPLYPAPDVGAVRRQLMREFPHAQDAVDAILGDLTGRTSVKFRPTILVGPPGSGKSRLVRRLAGLCGVHCGRFDGAGSSDNTFGGTARHWSTAETCFPLIVVRQAGYANPIVLVDEIDKAGASRLNGALTHALLNFLEIETAKSYPDPHILAPVDLSQVSYFLAANDVAALPAPLKDRCRILRLPSITAAHVPALVPAIIDDLAAERGIDPRWIEPLAADEIEIVTRLLGDGSVRRLRAIIERLLVNRERMAPRN